MAGGRQARPMFLSVEVIGMWCERGWQWVREHLITVPGVVLIFAATYLLMLAVNAGEVGAAWVQAVGSVAAIAAAIWIATRQQARDQEWRIADRAEQSCGMALRLHALITEYHLLVCRVLSDADVSVEGDRGVAGLLETLKERLDSNFDDDFDHHRQVEINNTRSCMAALIFILRHQDGSPASLRGRAEHLRLAREKAQASLDNSLVLYRKAFDERRKLRRPV